MINSSSASEFTRGWENVGHSLQMFRSSLHSQLLAVLLMGACGGTFSFYRSLGAERWQALPGYVAATVLVEIKVGKTRAVHAAKAKKLALVFEQRAPGFLIKQWAGRCLAYGALALMLTCGLVTGYGHRIMKDRQLRGTRLLDARKQPRKARARWLLGSVVGAAVGVIAVALFLGPEGRAAWSEYAWAAAAQVPQWGAWVSPDGTGREGWFGAPLDPGFYDVTAVYDAFRQQFDGEELGDAVGRIFFLILVCGAAGGCLFVAQPWGRVRVPKLGARRRDRAGPAPLKLAGMELTVRQETEHFLICGSPGAGKSVAVKQMLDQVRARGQRAIVYDVSGEYVSAFYDEKRDTILNPFDARSAPWTLWAEIRNSADYPTIARSLFPPGGREAFWHEAGAVLFAWTARVLAEEGHASNEGIYKALTHGTLEELHKLLEGTPAQRLLDPQAGNMPPNLLATTNLKVEPWGSLVDPPAGTAAFSIRDFIEQENRGGWLFLSCREDQRDVCKPLLSLWCDIAARAVLSLPEDRDRRIWCVLDEVASLQTLPALPPLMERGRKNGAAVMLGLQSMAQMREAYGRDGASALLSLPQTWLVLRMVEPEMAKWLEDALGHAEVEASQSSKSMGAHTNRDGVSIQRSIRRRAIAMASEIMGLPDMEGYLRQPGQGLVHRVAYSYETRPVRAPFFVPREEQRRRAS